MMNSNPISNFRAWTLALLGASLLSLGAACGAGGVDAEDVAETQVTLMTDMVAILESVDDPGSAQAMAKYSQQMAAVGQKLSAAYMRLAMNPELRDHLGELGEAMGSAMKDGMR